MITALKLITVVFLDFQWETPVNNFNFTVLQILHTIFEWFYGSVQLVYGSIEISNHIREACTAIKKCVALVGKAPATRSKFSLSLPPSAVKSPVAITTLLHCQGALIRVFLDCSS